LGSCSGRRFTGYIYQLVSGEKTFLAENFAIHWCFEKNSYLSAQERT